MEVICPFLLLILAERIVTMIAKEILTMMEMWTVQTWQFSQQISTEQIAARSNVTKRFTPGMRTKDRWT